MRTVQPEKTFEKLDELLSQLSKTPDIIAITETKLNHKLNSFLDGDGYEQCNSKIQAGGVCLFIRNSLNYEAIEYFNLNVQGCEEL